jgi:hypothetical protein
LSNFSKEFYHWLAVGFNEAHHLYKRTFTAWGTFISSISTPIIRFETVINGYNLFCISIQGYSRF